MNEFFDLKKEYADKLLRLRQGAAFMDSDASVIAKVKWEAEFRRLYDEVLELIQKLNEQGCEITAEQLWEGMCQND